MKPEDKKEILQIFSQGFEKVILPQIVSIHTRLDSIDRQLEKHGVKLDDHGYRLDRIERKLNAVVDRQDRQSLEIKSLMGKTS